LASKPAMILEEAGINIGNHNSPHGYIDFLLVTSTANGDTDSVGMLTHLPRNE